MSRDRIRPAKLDISLVIKENDRRAKVRSDHFHQVVKPEARKIQAKNPSYAWKTCCMHARATINIFAQI